MKIAKLIILQLFWYVSIKYGGQYFVPLIGLGLYFVDFFIFKKAERLSTRYFLFSLALILLGMGMDKAFEALGLLTWGNRFYPNELVSVWVIFPCYFYQFFKKFSSPVWLSFLMGFIFGPLAYYSGGNINSGIELELDPISLSTVAIFWGVFFCLSLFGYNKFFTTSN
mgnify:CR=1 FL=1